VQAGFSLSDFPGFALGGRWASENYGAFAPGGFNFGFSLTLQHTLPNHPILAGVAAFNGGNAVVYNNVAAQGCAEVVAHWNDDTPLVAAGAGPIAGRVVALNFHPVSDAFDPQYWQTSTNGEELLANAVGYAASARSHATAPAVALLAGDYPARASDVGCKLHNLELFSDVDVIDVRGAAPDLATLLGYEAVLAWTSSSYGDPNMLGDVLADYADLGRGVVQSTFSFDFFSGPRIGGRWQTGGYRPLTDADAGASSDSMTLTTVVAGHPILAEVTSFNGGTNSHHASPTALDAATTLVANWSNGQPFAAAGFTATGGRTIGLNMDPPSSDVDAASWDRHTDGARIIANALLLAAEGGAPPNQPPTVDAGADQTIEATGGSATALTAGYSATLTATASDPDNDSLTLTWTGAVPPTTGQSITVTLGPLPWGEASQTYAFVVTAADGRGGEATDTVNVIVRDTQGPELHGMPSGMLEVEATGPGGADVKYGPVVATDAVDGDVDVTCAPLPGLFALGDTLVNCSASDSRGNTTQGSFTVRVTASDPDPDAPGKPGKMIGYGYLRNEGRHYEFSFTAVERPSGAERGGLLLTVKPGHRNGRRRGDRFVSRSVDSVIFDADSTVLFTGTGRWNGQDGYRYEVSAADKTVRRRRHDIVRITITSPAGEIVAQVDGRVMGGDIQFVRIRR
jgi:hypothetical protein